MLGVISPAGGLPGIEVRQGGLLIVDIIIKLPLLPQIGGTVRNSRGSADISPCVTALQPPDIRQFIDQMAMVTKLAGDLPLTVSDANQLVLFIILVADQCARRTALDAGNGHQTPFFILAIHPITAGGRYFFQLPDIVIREIQGMTIEIFEAG
ncbi:Uncharacterised protein [Yersinia pseudotuberculosis]|nr:Uncharacterised protein [Yersinia pseudotuberculosis]